MLNSCTEKSLVQAVLMLSPAVSVSLGHTQMSQVGCCLISGLKDAEFFKSSVTQMFRTMDLPKKVLSLRDSFP